MAAPAVTVMSSSAFGPKPCAASVWASETARRSQPGQPPPALKIVVRLPRYRRALAVRFGNGFERGIIVATMNHHGASGNRKGNKTAAPVAGV